MSKLYCWFCNGTGCSKCHGSCVIDSSRVEGSGFFAKLKDETRTLKEIKEDHEDEKRRLVAQWSDHCAQVACSAIWKSFLFGLFVGVISRWLI